MFHQLRKEEKSLLHLFFLFSFFFLLHFLILVSAGGEEGVLLTQVLDGENTHCIYTSGWEETNVH